MEKSLEITAETMQAILKQVNESIKAHPPKDNESPQFKKIQNKRVELEWKTVFHEGIADISLKIAIDENGAVGAYTLDIQGGYSKQVKKKKKK